MNSQRLTTPILELVKTLFYIMYVRVGYKRYPNYDDIGREFYITRQAVKYRMDILKKERLITMKKGKHRAMRLTKTGYRMLFAYQPLLDGGNVDVFAYLANKSTLVSAEDGWEDDILPPQFKYIPKHPPISLVKVEEELSPDSKG